MNQILQSLSYLFICYYGSPGTGDDFSLLKGELPRSQFLIQEKNEKIKLNSNEKSIVLAYSWGAVRALNDVVKNMDSVSAVILISPYVFPSKVSFIKKIILKIPYLGDLILNSKREKAIDDFLKNSSYPKEIPNIYGQQKEKLMDLDLLKGSILEKDQIIIPSKKDLLKLKEKSIPVFVIWGNHDKSSTKNEQIDPLRTYLKIERLSIIEDGGHALVWTHPKKIAENILDFLRSI